MEYTFLGRTRLQVSHFYLGSMNFGYVTNETESFKIMDAAIDEGIFFLILLMCMEVYRTLIWK